jgi:hypothetical protein
MGMNGVYEECEECGYRGIVGEFAHGSNLMFFEGTTRRLLCDECGENLGCTFSSYREDLEYLPIHSALKYKRMTKWR